MSYSNLKTKGVLAEVSFPNLVERVSNSELVSPEKVYTTRVHIKDGSKSWSEEVFGIVPGKYVGKQVTLVNSYHALPDSKLKLFMQEFYVGKKRVLNEAIVKRA